MTEDKNFVSDAARKAWVSPAVIEGSLELDTQGAGGAATDPGIS